jgi:hypothetical protein
MERLEPNQPRWISISILVRAGFFIFALVLSAVLEPRIRLLHAFQALIYVAVIVLTRRNSAWGFGAGCLISAFWNYIFIRGAAEELWAFLTGRLLRPDLALQLAATGAHFLLIIACLTSFVRLRPGVKRWTEFLAGGALAIGYLILIIVTTGPEYMIPLLKRVFGW